MLKFKTNISMTIVIVKKIKKVFGNILIKIIDHQKLKKILRPI